MLNIPIIHREMVEVNTPKLSIFEEIEYRQKIIPNYWEHQFLVETIIQKNEIDGKFIIIIKNFPFSRKSFTIYLNNTMTYVSQTIDSPKGTEIIFTSRMLKNTLIKDVTSISINSAANMYFPFKTPTSASYWMWKNFGELMIKLNKNEPTNKNFLIDEKGLEIESYSSISFRQNKLGVKVIVNKSIIKIIPKKLIAGKHNFNMFYVQNISKTKLPLILANTIEGLKLSGTSKKTKAVYTKLVNPDSMDLINGIVGNISFNENTYYDFKEDKTHIGIGVNSQEGYIIPYRFKGDLIPILSLNIASINNILIGFSNPIKNAYFDKISGLIKLKIIESKNLFDNEYLNQNIILNKDFSKIISGNLSLEDILNLGKNE